jgi:hypothetical protein
VTCAERPRKRNIGPPLNDAERARRYRAAKRGESVPKYDPGPRPGTGGRPRIYHQWRAISDAMVYLAEVDSVEDIMDDRKDGTERGDLAEVLIDLAYECVRLHEGLTSQTEGN